MDQEIKNIIASKLGGMTVSLTMGCFAIWMASYAMIALCDAVERASHAFP